MKTVRLFWLLATPFLLATSLFISSCDDDDDKDDNETSQVSNPKITISSPSAGSTIGHGEMVMIKAEVSHSETIHEYTYELKNTSADEVVLTKTDHVHDGKELTIEADWMNMVEDHSDMVLTIKASDHNDRVGTATVNFHCHPKEDGGGHGGHNP